MRNSSATIAAILVAATAASAQLRGPNAPYNPRDLAATRPIVAAEKAGVARALTGSIDLHLHLAPMDPERPIDVIDAAKLAKSMGMRGILITSHYEPTAAIAYIVRKAVPGLEVFGGISFERATGGLNTAAIEQMLRDKGGYGRLVEFPTFDTAWRKQPENMPFVPVSRNGELVPEAKQVIAMIAKHNLLMSTGHSSPAEVMLLVREAAKQGVKNMIVGNDADLSLAQLKELVKLGAYIEFAKQNEDFPGDSYAKRVLAVGADHAILAEVGLSIYPPDLVGQLAASLIRQGATERDLDVMMKRNPARVLGLP